MSEREVLMSEDLGVNAAAARDMLKYERGRGGKAHKPTVTALRNFIVASTKLFARLATIEVEREMADASSEVEPDPLVGK